MAAPPDETLEFNFALVLGVLVRRRWVILGSMALSIAAAAIHVTTSRPVYSATALLLIEKEEKGRAQSETTVSETKADDYYQTQYRLLKTRTLLQRVYDALNLKGVEEFAGGVGLLIPAVSIAAVRSSRLVNVSAESYDPELAMRIANTLAEVYVAQNLESKLFISRDILLTLREKFDDRAGAEEKYQFLPAVVNNALIQQLKANYAGLEGRLGELTSRYTQAHPDRIRIKAEMQAVETRIRVETLRAVQGMKAELSGQLLGNNVRIVDPAERPSRPVRPNKRRTIGLAGGLGIALGLIIAFGIEHLDMTIRSQEDVELRLGLPFLGAVSRTDAFKGATAKEFHDLLSGPASFTGEAFKNIRTMIGFASAGHPMKRLLVTSSVQSEGKTFLTINLAMVFAQLGQRVLLIEGDLRRPNLHRRFELPRDMGISHFLAHGRSVAELPALCNETGFTNLKVMVCGTVPPNPAELLSAPKLKTLMDWAAENFDQVFVDGTPVFPITDALLWSRAVDSGIFVAHFGSIHAKLALRAKQKLVEGGLHLAGAIINQVSLKGGAYYGDYYYKYYRYYNYSAETRKA